MVFIIWETISSPEIEISSERAVLLGPSIGPLEDKNQTFLKRKLKKKNQTPLLTWAQHLIFLFHSFCEKNGVMQFSSDLMYFGVKSSSILKDRKERKASFLKPCVKCPVRDSIVLLSEARPRAKVHTVPNYYLT